MAKNSPFSNPAFQQKQSSGAGFNLVPQSNNFQSVFDVKPLDEVDVTTIENLLIENSHPDSMSAVQVKQDIDSLKALTAEIKAIGRQGILLMGERVSKARDMLKSYHQGTFTRWLSTTFGSRKTGYNLLTYYDFYSSLSNQELKEKFRKIPQKAAYILASRKGDMKKKEEIVLNYSDQKPIKLISLIHENLPADEEDRRSPKDRELKQLAKLTEALQALLYTTKQFTRQSRVLLEELKVTIDAVLDAPEIKNRKENKRDV